MSKSTPRGEVRSWSEYETRDERGLDALPDAVRAIVEECKAQSETTSAKRTLADDGQEPPYPCRMYEEVPGEEELLQLQWMRIDMSNMDSERCWGEHSGCDEEYDCGPDSGLMLPAVYRLDPAQLFPLTFVGLPPELLRVQRESEGVQQRVAQEVPEDRLCKLGKDLTEELSRGAGRPWEGLPPDLGAEVASLGDTDWAMCLERHVDLLRCDPAILAEVLSTRAPPTLDCLVGTVLPSLLAGISSHRVAAASQEKANKQRGEGVVTGNGRDEAAVRAICRLAASVASTSGEDPVRFRNRLSRSGLRKLGQLGREAELALAEAFFYLGADRPL